mmetsp:Transcript_20950/g.53561  ORF Transcript_20950/g.53561 Transcript_20950/m.53561 type:complete len:218 (+) Transcript_20950:307-960(+)
MQHAITAAPIRIRWIYRQLCCWRRRCGARGSMRCQRPPAVTIRCGPGTKTRRVYNVPSRGERISTTGATRPRRSALSMPAAALPLIWCSSPHHALGLAPLETSPCASRGCGAQAFNIREDIIPSIQHRTPRAVTRLPGTNRMAAQSMTCLLTETSARAVPPRGLEHIDSDQTWCWNHCCTATLSVHPPFLRGGTLHNMRTAPCGMKVETCYMYKALQ